MILAGGGDQGLHPIKDTMSIPAETVGTIAIVKVILGSKRGDQSILPSHTHRNKHNKYNTGSDWPSETTPYNLMPNSYNYWEIYRSLKDNNLRAKPIRYRK